jgi:hypothetical protein
VYPKQDNKVILPLLPLEIRAPCKERWVWAGAVIFASVTCSLQFAEASAATPLQPAANKILLVPSYGRVDSFGIDLRFETVRASSAFNFVGLDSNKNSKVQIDSKED